MKTVLLIDDDEIVRSMCAEALDAAGWRVLEAENGEKGIAMAAEHRPDAILCDLMMPRCNGFQVCRAVRANPDLKGIHIIVSSGRGYANDIKAALDAGADAFLQKPVDLRQLVEAMGKVTERNDTAVTQPAAAPAPIASLADNGPMRVRFWGVRGSIPTPGAETVRYGGNTTCVCVRAEGEIIVLDAGTGIRGLGKSLVQEFKDQPIRLTLLISHTHWDHIQGFPFFIPAYNPNNQLRVLGYEGSKAGLEGVLASQMESPYFPIGLKQMPSYVRIEELKDLQFKLGNVEVVAWFMNHPGVCMGYRLNTRHGSVAFLPDNEPHQRLRAQPTGASSSSPRAMEFARTEDAKMIDFVRGVDVMIIDAQYDLEQYQNHIGWGHGCLDDVVDLALEAQVKNLFLFHHDPDHDDAHIDKRVEHARSIVARKGGNLRVEASREGLEVVLQDGVLQLR